MQATKEVLSLENQDRGAGEWRRLLGPRVRAQSNGKNASTSEPSKVVETVARAFSLIIKFEGVELVDVLTVGCKDREKQIIDYVHK